MKRTMLLLVAGVSVVFQAAGATISPVGGTSSPVLLWGVLPNVYDGIIDYDSFVGLSPDGGWAHFDLGSAYNLTGMNLWNNAGSVGDDTEGINSFALTFQSAGLDTIGTFSGNATDALAPQFVSFGSGSVSAVRYVELTINSSHGRPYAVFLRD